MSFDDVNNSFGEKRSPLSLFSIERRRHMCMCVCSNNNRYLLSDLFTEETHTRAHLDGMSILLSTESSFVSSACLRMKLRHVSMKFTGDLTFICLSRLHHHYRKCLRLVLFLLEMVFIFSLVGEKNNAVMKACDHWKY